MDELPACGLVTSCLPGHPYFRASSASPDAARTSTGTPFVEPCSRREAVNDAHELAIRLPCAEGLNSALTPSARALGSAMSAMECERPSVV